MKYMTQCRKQNLGCYTELDEVRRNIITQGWQRFVDAKGPSNVSISLEFLANWPERQDNMVKVRRKNVLVTPQAINLMYVVPDYANEEEQLI